MRKSLAGIASGLLLLLASVSAGRADDDAALRADLLQSMRQGNAAAMPGVPNLVDLLRDRFPEDFNALLDTFIAATKAKQLPRSMKIEVAKTLVAIQAREGARIASAPRADLLAVITTQRDIITALAQSHTELCKTIVGGGPVWKAPTREIGRLFFTRLHLVLTAIANGRDHPVPARAMRDDDYVDFAVAAKQRGVDIKQWSVLADDELPQSLPDDVCRALASTYQAALDTKGDLGERVLVGFSEELLIADLDIYRPALEK